MDYKTSTIAKLWNGEIQPVMHMDERSTEIKELEKLIRLNYEKLEENLENELKDRLENYRDCIDEYMALVNEQAFCKGFCLGTSLTAEALIEGSK